MYSIDVKLNYPISLFVLTFRYTSLFRNFFHNCSWFLHRNCVTMLCFHIPALLLWYCNRIFNRNTFTMLLGNMETFLNWYCFWNRMTFFSGHSITLLYWLGWMNFLWNIMALHILSLNVSWRLTVEDSPYGQDGLYTSSPYDNHTQHHDRIFCMLLSISLYK